MNCSKQYSMTGHIRPLSWKLSATRPGNWPSDRNEGRTHRVRVRGRLDSSITRIRSTERDGILLTILMGKGSWNVLNELPARQNVRNASYEDVKKIKFYFECIIRRFAPFTTWSMYQTLTRKQLLYSRANPRTGVLSSDSRSLTTPAGGC